MRWFLFLVLGALLLAGVVVASSGGATLAEARWVITDLGTLGGEESIAYAINEHGQVVGSAETKAKTHDAYPAEHAFLWQNGKMRDLGVLRGWDDSVALSINERGQIIGVCSGKHGGKINPARAFVWESGGLRDLGTLVGDRWSAATGINDRGQVIGYSWTKDFDWEYPQAHAFLWEGSRTGSRMRALGALPSDTFSLPIAINERGHVIGLSWRGGMMHGFLWKDGKMRDLGMLPNAINDRGQIVGSSAGALLWENGKVRDLGTLLGGRSIEAKAIDINDHGQVVGESETKGSHTHAFLWEKGLMRDLGAVGGGASYVTAITNKGQVLGYSLRFPERSDSLRRDFVWRNGTATSLWSAFVESFEATAINDRGQVVGRSGDVKSATYHAVLWTLKR